MSAWVSGVHAAPPCDEAPVASTGNAASAASGQQYLGQGIALFEAKNFKMAEQALQSALFAGLPDRQERSSAQKYLAFVYCTGSEWVRCEAAFDAAFAARPAFRLDDYEIRDTPWRDAYRKSLARWTAQCGNAAPVSPGNVQQQTAATPVPSGFALNSTAIVAIAPLTSTAASRVAQPSVAKRAVRSDSNVLLRVAPWAHVQVDGKRQGVTPPLTELKLSVGAHTVELLSPGFETVRRVIQVTVGETVMITHDFDAR